MKNSDLLIVICKILFPFILLFGFYVIMNGHLTPGGGFQGGAILATAILISYFIYPNKLNDLNLLIRIEKFIFIVILLLSSVSILTNGHDFTNYLPIKGNGKILFLTTLNLWIGMKVATGLILIFSTFIKEGE